MRRLPGLLLVVMLVCSACTGSSSDDRPAAPRTSSAPRAATLDVDWPTTLDAGAPPGAPAGFDDAKTAAMGKILTRWADRAALDAGAWHSGDPLGDVRDVLPGDTAGTLGRQSQSQVSPHLAVANVFGRDVEVVGKPRVTSAWKVSTDKDPAGERFVQLELQTRTAYRVRQDGGPERTIGVLRVHGLTAYADTKDDYGVTGGWQEFGAGDCALAIEDVLVPDSDAAEVAEDLRTFADVGNGSKLVMPPLGSDDKLDDDYLKRCRDGSV